MLVRLVNSKLCFADDGRKTITLFDGCIKQKAKDYASYGTFTKLIPGKEYTFSFKSTGSFSLYLRDKNNDNVNFKVNGKETSVLNVSSGDNSYNIEVLSDTYIVRVVDNTTTDVYVVVTTKARSLTRTLMEQQINAPAKSSGYVDYELTNAVSANDSVVMEISSEQSNFKLTLKNSNKEVLSYTELFNPYFNYGIVSTQDIKYVRVTDNADYPVNIKFYKTEVVY